MSECLLTLFLFRRWDVIFCFLKGQETERRPPTNQRWGWIELRVPSVSVYSTLKQTHHDGVYLFPFVMSQRGDFQDKRMLSKRLTRKRSEVWLFSFTGRFDTLAFLAVASFIFAHLFAQLVMSVVWRPFFVSGWAKLGIPIQNYELWFVTVSIFRPTVKIVETNGATSAEVCAIPLLCKMKLPWIHSCLCSPIRQAKWTPTNRGCQATEATCWTSSGTPSTTTSSPPAPRTPRFVLLLNVSPTCSHFRRNMSM